MRNGTSRALEVVVAILLAAATITAGIGVYRSANHQAAALWWALCSGTFILAAVAPLFALVVHPLFAQRRIQAGSAAPPDQPAAATSAWIKAEDLGKYLDEINATMEEHGFGRNPNLLQPNGAGREPADPNPRETYRAALIGKGMDVRRSLLPGAGVSSLVTTLVPFDSRPTSSWLGEAQTFLYVEGSRLADATLVRGYVNAEEAVKAVDATLEALRHVGSDETIPF